MKHCYNEKLSDHRQNHEFDANYIVTVDLDKLQLTESANWACKSQSILKILDYSMPYDRQVNIKDHLDLQIDVERLW